MKVEEKKEMEDKDKIIGQMLMIRIYRYTDEDREALGDKIDDPKAVKEYMLNYIRERLDKEKADSIMEWVSQCTKGQILMMKQMIEAGDDIEPYKDDFLDGIM